MKNTKRFLALLLAFLLAFGNLSTVVVAAGEGDGVVPVEESAAAPEAAPAEAAPAAEAETQEVPTEPAQEQAPAEPASQEPELAPVAPETPAEPEPAPVEPEAPAPAETEPAPAEQPDGGDEMNENEYSSDPGTAEPPAPATVTVTFKFTVDGQLQPDVTDEYTAGAVLAEPDEAVAYEQAGYELTWYKDEYRLEEIDFDTDIIIVGAEMTVWCDVVTPAPAEPAPTEVPAEPTEEPAAAVTVLFKVAPVKDTDGEGWTLEKTFDEGYTLRKEDLPVEADFALPEGIVLGSWYLDEAMFDQNVTLGDVEAVAAEGLTLYAQAVDPETEYDVTPMGYDYTLNLNGYGTLKYSKKGTGSGTLRVLVYRGSDCVMDTTITNHKRTAGGWEVEVPGGFHLVEFAFASGTQTRHKDSDTVWRLTSCTIGSSNTLTIRMNEDCHCGRSSCDCPGNCDCPPNCGCLDCIKTTNIAIHELVYEIGISTTDFVDSVVITWTAEDGVTRTSTTTRTSLNNMKVPCDRHFTLQVNILSSRTWNRKSSPGWTSNGPYFNFFDMYNPASNGIVFDHDSDSAVFMSTTDNPTGITVDDSLAKVLDIRFSVIDSYHMQIIFHKNGGTTARAYVDYYEQNGNRVTNAKHDFGKTISLGHTAAHANENGHKVMFLGWTRKDTDEKIYRAGDSLPTMVTSVVLNPFNDIDLYPVWAIDSNDNGTADVYETVLTVTYDLYGGSGSGFTDNNKYVYGNTVTVLNKEPTPPGFYEFVGWRNNADTSRTYYGGNTFTITKDTTLTALYAKETRTITVKVTNGTADPAGPVKVPVGNEQIIKFTPNPGYVLDTATVDGRPVELDDEDGHYRFWNVTLDQTIEVVFAEDKLGPGGEPDGIPDKYQKTVTYKVVNGKWNDGSTEEKTEVFTVSTNSAGTWSSTPVTHAAPEVGARPNPGYSEGSWSPALQTSFDVNSPASQTFTYTYEQDLDDTVDLTIHIKFYKEDADGSNKVEQTDKNYDVTVPLWRGANCPVDGTGNFRTPMPTYPGYKRVTHLDDQYSWSTTVKADGTLDPAENTVEVIYQKDPSDVKDLTFNVQYLGPDDTSLHDATTVTKNIWAGDDSYDVQPGDITIEPIPGYAYDAANSDQLPKTVHDGETVTVKYFYDGNGDGKDDTEQELYFRFETAPIQVAYDTKEHSIQGLSLKAVYVDGINVGDTVPGGTSVTINGQKFTAGQKVALENWPAALTEKNAGRYTYDEATRKAVLNSIVINHGHFQMGEPTTGKKSYFEWWGGFLNITRVNVTFTVNVTKEYTGDNIKYTFTAEDPWNHNTLTLPLREGDQGLWPNHKLTLVETLVATGKEPNVYPATAVEPGMATIGLGPTTATVKYKIEDAEGIEVTDNYTATFNATMTIIAKSFPGPDATDNKGITVDIGENEVYDGTEHKHTPTVKDGEKLLVPEVDYTYSYADGQNFTNVGTVTVTITGKGNYSGEMKVSYDITPKPITVMAKDAKKTFGDPDPDFDVEITGRVNESDAITYNVTRADAGTPDGESVGEHAVTVTGTSGGKGPETQGNYSVTFEDGTLTIEAKKVPELSPDGKIEGFTVTLPTDVPYNGSVQAQKPTISDTVITVDGKPYELVEDTDYTLTYDPVDPTNVGEVKVTVTFTGNYKGTDGAEYTYTYQITPAKITVKANDVNKEYNGQPHGAVDVPGWTVVEGQDLDGFYGNDANNYNITYTGEKTNVGDYVGEIGVQFTLKNPAAPANYDIQYLKGDLHITAKSVTDDDVDPEIKDPDPGSPEDPKPPVEPTPNPDGNYKVTWPNNVVYSGADQKQGVTIVDKALGDEPLVAGEDYTITYSGDTTNVGTVTMTVKFQGNYSGELTHTYNIFQRTITLQANGGSKVYDGLALVAKGYTIVGEADQAFAKEIANYYTVNVSGELTAPGTAKSTVTAEWKENGPGTVANLKFKYVEGELKVIKRGSEEDKENHKPFEITVVAKSDDTKTYTGSEQSVSGLVTDTFPVTSDDKVSTFEVTVEGLDASASGTNAGTYPTTFTGTPVVKDAAGNNVTDQFTVKTENGNLVINKATITVKPKDATKKYDGKPLTASEIEIVGPEAFKTDEFLKELNDHYEFTFDGSQTRVGEGVSTVKEVKEKGEAPYNFDFNTNPGKLTVTDRDPGDKFEITVQANSGEKVYNGELQSVDGFVSLEVEVGGAKFTVSGLTAHGEGTDVGTYTVAVGGTAIVKDAEGEDVTSQFTVDAKTGTLTITPAEVKPWNPDPVDPGEPEPTPPADANVKVVWPEDTVYNGEDQKLPVTLTDLKTGKTIPESAYTVTYDGDTLNAGTVKVSITFKTEAGVNYSGSITGGSYTIKPAPITLQPVHVEKTYDGAPLMADECDPINDTKWFGADKDKYDFTYTGSQTVPGEGRSQVKATLKDSETHENYTFTYKDGTLKVNAITDPSDLIPITFTANSDRNVTYDGKEHEVNGFTIGGSNITGAADGSSFTMSVAGGTATYTVEDLSAHASGTKANTYPVTVNGDARIIQDGQDVASQFAVVTVPGELIIKAKGVDPKDVEPKVEEADPNDPEPKKPEDMVDPDPDREGNFEVTWPNNVEYNGTKQEQGVTIVDKALKKTLVENEDYTITYDPTDPTDVGEVKMTVTFTGNYSGTLSGSYKIFQKAVTVTADNKEKTYGEADPELTVKIDGVVAGEDATKLIHYSITRPDKDAAGGENVGEHDIIVTGDKSQDNYSVTFVNGKLTINKKGIDDSKIVEPETTPEPDPNVPDPTPSPEPKPDPKDPDIQSGENELWVAWPGSVTYNTAKHEQEPVIYDLQAEGGPVKLTKDVDYELSWTGETTNVTEEGVTVTVTFKADANYSGSLTGHYDIIKANATVTSENAEKTYDGTALTNHEYKVEPEKFTNDVKTCYTVEFTGKATVPGDTEEENNKFDVTHKVGEYENLTIIPKYGKLTINGRSEADKFEITVQAKGDTVTYDGEEHSVSGFESTEFTIGEGDSAFKVTVEGLSASVSGTAAGTYTSEVKGTAVVKDEANNDVTDQFKVSTENGTLTISAKSVGNTDVEPGVQQPDPNDPDPKPTPTDPDPSHEGNFTVTWPANVEYDGQAHRQGVTIVDGALGYTLRQGTDYDITYTGDVTNAGTVQMTVTFKGDYAGTLQESYSIFARGITVTTQGGSKTYDGQPLTNNAANIDRLAAGETATAVANGAVTNAGSAVNGYTIAWGTANAANYRVTGEDLGTLTVSPRNVTLTSATQSWTYNGVAHQNTTVTVGGDGFAQNEGADYSNFASITNQGSVSNTFQYTLRSGVNALNYNITQQYGALTVTAANAAAVMTVGTPANAMYDGAAHLWTPTVTGVGGRILQAGVDYTVNYNTADFVNAGTVVATITARGNYAGVVTRTYQITPRVVTMTSASATKVYDGTALRNANVTATGFVAGQGATYRAIGQRTPAGTADNIFTYTFNANTQARNYTVRQVYGTLTVTEASMASATVNTPGSVRYDGASHQWMPVVTRNGRTLREGDDYTVSYNTADFVNAGTIRVTITGHGSYTGSIIRTYQITPRTVVMRSPSATKAYDGTALRSTNVTATGFVAGQGATYRVTGSRTAEGTAENTFTYTLNANTLASNYTISQVFGTLTVTEAVADENSDEDSDENADAAAAAAATAAPTASPAPVDITEDDTPLGDRPLGDQPEGDADGYTLSEEAIIDEDMTPLGGAPKATECCVLHFILTLCALGVTVYYIYDNKKRQAREFELRAEL